MVDVSGCQEGCHPFMENNMNELKFTKYPSIENVDRKKTIDYIAELGLDQLPWQVSLKVHGANFQITTNSEDMKTGKRSGFIVPDYGTFHNQQNVLARYQQNVLEFYKFMKTIYPDFEQLTLFGELFGGGYNHPDVDRDNHASRVQKGVEYCPHNDFFLFDVKLDGIFVHKLYIKIAIKDFGFVGGNPLFQGSLRDCLQYPNEFPDPLHKNWGLPEIEDNVCEGVVIEPEDPKYFPNGSRVILKNKNAKFAEKASHRKPRKVQMPHEWSEAGTRELEEVSLYITENRLRNVLSHIGEVNDKMFGKIMGLTSQDAFKSYLKDRNDKFSALDSKEQDMVKKQMNKFCADMIRPVFRDIMDGEY